MKFPAIWIILGLILAQGACSSPAQASDSLKNKLFCQIDGSKFTYEVSSQGPTRAVTVLVHSDSAPDITLPSADRNAVVAGYYADMTEVKLILEDPRIVKKDEQGHETPDADADIDFKLKVKFKKADAADGLNTYAGSLNMGLSDELAESGSVVCKCEAAAGQSGQRQFVSCPDPMKH